MPHASFQCFARDPSQEFRIDVFVAGKLVFVNAPASVALLNTAIIVVFASEAL